MGFLNLIFGKSAEACEKSGDDFFRKEVWGQAKLEYESAIYKLEKQSVYNEGDLRRLKEKIARSSEVLALSHKRNGEEMMESGSYDDARELFALALELTRDPALERELRALTKRPEKETIPEIHDDADAPEELHEDEQAALNPPEDEDHFIVLCSTLPRDIQREYRGYGNNFMKGYLALNNGDFDRASDLLSRSMDENPSLDSYIPFELSTACINLGKTDEAEGLLEGFLLHHPDSLPAYQALCEIYWDKAEYRRVEALIDSFPTEVAESVGAFFLRGETYFREGRYQEGRDFYSNIIEEFGWSEAIARELAKNLEALNEKEQALELYGKILQECTGCGIRPDVFIKKKFADLSLSSGRHTTKILEIYLSLVQEDPQNAGEYYAKVSSICELQGNIEEAERFREIAERYDSNWGKKFDRRIQNSADISQ